MLKGHNHTCPRKETGISSVDQRAEREERAVERLFTDQTRHGEAKEGQRSEVGW